MKTRKSEVVGARLDKYYIGLLEESNLTAREILELSLDILNGDTPDLAGRKIKGIEKKIEALEKEREFWLQFNVEDFKDKLI